MPWAPTSAAAVFTLKLPPSVLADDQAERLPVSKPSAKIRSGNGVFVTVGVNVGVIVDVNNEVGVGVSVGIAVAVGVGVRVGVGVSIGVADPM
jgi:hypothetical protein